MLNQHTAGIVVFDFDTADDGLDLNNDGVDDIDT